jgi:hypothetical protein
MVNTFVPSTSFEDCAKQLDYRRLGKQRVEAYQLWRAITGQTIGWRNHPAAKAWEEYPCALALYCNTMIKEWIHRGYKNNMKYLPHCAHPKMPWWWGWKPVHMSHQAALNRKMSSFYKYDVGEYAKYGYCWPTKVPKQFRLALDPPLDEILCEIST